MREKLKWLLTSPVFICLIAFAVRMLLLYRATLIMPPQVRENLPYGYELGRVARAIAAGEGFSSPLRMVETGPTVWFTPIFPYLVAAIFKIWGIYSELSHFIIETLNIALVALTVIPIHSIAKKTFGAAVAAGASWTWVFLPTALFFPLTWVWDTAMSALFLALIFWATLSMLDAESDWAWLGYGALWATGVLINPSMMSLFPFLVGWVAWKRREQNARWIRNCAMVVVVFTAGLVPWTVRNYVVFHKVIVLRSNFGLELWLGNNPGVADTWSPWFHPNDDAGEAEKYKRMGEIAYMAEKQKEAVDFMVHHPGDTLNFMFHRFVNNWLAITDSPADSWSSSPLYVKGFMTLNILLSLFTLLGVLFAYRARIPEALPFALVVLIFPLVFYLTHTSLRYRFPMDPIMMVLAASGVAYPLQKWRAWRKPEGLLAVRALSSDSSGKSGL
jgi:hypothetical protein